MKRTCLFLVGSCLAFLLVSRPTLAGTYANITIDDAYADWASIPTLITDPVDAVNAPDIDYVQIANDETYLYIRFHYHTAQSFSTYLAIDNDSNPATGYNVAGLGIVGSEAGYANDFDFDQRAGFNIGTLKDPVNPTEPASGAAILSSFVDSADREMAIRLDTTFDPFVGPGPVFPTNTFTLMFYTLDSSFAVADTTNAVQYTLASVPEPAALMLATIGAAVGFSSRRRPHNGNFA